MNLDKLSSLDRESLYREFQKACEDPTATQSAVLTDILERNKTCELGRRRRFEDMIQENDPVESFRRNVPLTEWTDYETLASRTADGEFDLMFSGKPVHFVATTGTTAAMKLLPESSEGALAKQITVDLRRRLNRRMEAYLQGGKLLALFNPTPLGTTACGIPIGSASALTMENSATVSLLPFPKQILECLDPEFQQDAVMRFAVAENVVAFGANNIDRFISLFERTRRRAETIIREIETGTLELTIPNEPGLRGAVEAALHPNPARAEELRTVLQTTGDFIPSGYWPNLKAVSCWLGGSVGGAVQRVRPYLGRDIVFKDAGYGASEGKFNIPVDFNTPVGTLALWGAFYEFLPEDGLEPLTADQVRDDTVYELVITTYSGLYRYRMHDRVRIAGFTGRTPNIVFESKAADYANVAGEKTYSAVLIDAVQKILDRNRLTVTHWGVFPDEATKEYVLCIEPTAPISDVSALIREFDNQLQESSLVYKVFREQELIRRPKIMLLRAGWKQSLLSGKDVERSKLPVVLSALPDAEWILSRPQVPARD